MTGGRHCATVNDLEVLVVGSVSWVGKKMVCLMVVVVVARMLLVEEDKSEGFMPISLLNSELVEARGGMRRYYDLARRAMLSW